MTLLTRLRIRALLNDATMLDNHASYHWHSSHNTKPLTRMKEIAEEKRAEALRLLEEESLSLRRTREAQQRQSAWSPTEEVDPRDFIRNCKEP